MLLKKYAQSTPDAGIGAAAVGDALANDARVLGCSSPELLDPLLKPSSGLELDSITSAEGLCSSLAWALALRLTVELF